MVATLHCLKKEMGFSSGAYTLIVKDYRAEVESEDVARAIAIAHPKYFSTTPFARDSRIATSYKPENEGQPAAAAPAPVEAAAPADAEPAPAPSPTP